MDVDNENKDLGALTPSDAEEAFLNRWKDAEELSEDEEGAPDSKDTPEIVEEDDTEDDQTEEDSEDQEDPEDSEESDKTKKAKDKFVDDEESKVKVKVGDEELAVSVKDLKRLYGQEASLTKKSQELAQKRKEVEDQGAVHLVGLQRLYEKAVERYQPFSQIDMLVASKQMDAEELSVLRQEAAKAYEDVYFLEQELKGFAGSIEYQRTRMIQEQARAAIEVLKDPEKGVPNWSESVYNDIRRYAVNNGMPIEIVNQIVDPVVIKSLWKAMTYDNGKAVATVKKAKSPKKVLKSKTTSESGSFSKSEATQAISKLRSTGSRDDAANAFLSRWGIGRDE